MNAVSAQGLTGPATTFRRSGGRNPVAIRRGGSYYQPPSSIWYFAKLIG